jgi:hypothetical protein
MNILRGRCYTAAKGRGECYELSKGFAGRFDPGDDGSWVLCDFRIWGGCWGIGPCCMEELARRIWKTGITAGKFRKI